MALHFSPDELAHRRARACAAMTEAGLDGLLMFRQESMYYLTGYDTFGYVFFQCLYLGADGRFFLITRAPDLLQARHTSVIEDIRIWIDAPDAEPAKDLSAVLEEYGAKGKRLGVEYEAYGLTARNGKRLEAAFAEPGGQALRGGAAGLRAARGRLGPGDAPQARQKPRRDRLCAQGGRARRSRARRGRAARRAGRL